MRFTDFLRATVLSSAASASLLGALAVVGAGRDGNRRLVLLLAGWWLACAAFGLFLGRRGEPNPGIRRLLASARATPTLPEVRPARMLLNRLWPLLLVTLAGGALALVFPQVAGIFGGGAIIWALHWRRQEGAVAAIEERDGVRFFVESTRAWEPIRLVRTPGFKASFFSFDRAPAETPAAS
jgi:hypothetical protein